MALVVAAPIAAGLVLDYLCCVKPDIWTLMEEKKLRMVPLPEVAGPWSPIEAAPVLRNRRALLLASVLLLVEAFYVVMHLIP